MALTVCNVMRKTPAFGLVISREMIFNQENLKEEIFDKNILIKKVINLKNSLQLFLVLLRAFADLCDCFPCTFFSFKSRNLVNVRVFDLFESFKRRQSFFVKLV